MENRYLIPAIQERLIKVEELLKPVLPLLKEREELMKFLSDANVSSVPQNRDNDVLVYDASLSWWEKTKFILKVEGKPMTTSEVANYALSQEPNLDRTKIVRLISHALTSNVGKKTRKIIEQGKDQKFELM